MKKILFVTLIAGILNAAILSDTKNSLRIEAKYYDQNESCLLILIEAKLIGTQKEVYGKDLVKFLVYDDGKIIVSKEIGLPVEVAVERNLTLFYPGKLNTKSPGVAIESEELGLYIDPLHYTVIHQSCKPLKSNFVEKTETRDLCIDLQTVGFRCGETSK